MSITLSQIQYVLALDEHRHFAKAAKHHHISQPTLSQQLQKLEDEIGIILFDRAKKPILPTPEGERWIKQAKEVVREFDRLSHLSSQVRGGEVAGDFRLGVIPTVASYLLPHMVQVFSRDYPKVVLKIEELKTETILSELSQDRLDGAILATPLEGEDVKVHPLYYEPFYAYFSKGHPLLAKNRIKKEDLDISQIWLLQDGHCFKDQVMDFCARKRDLPLKGTRGGNSGIRFQSGSLDTLKRLVQTNEGFTLLPAMMALSLPRSEQEGHLRPILPPVPTREISMIYRRDHWKLAIIRSIEKSIRDSLPKGIHLNREKQDRVIPLG